MSNTKLPKVDGDNEAHLIALCCSKERQGFARWSLRMLADKMIELKHVEHISYETIRKVLKKRVESLESDWLGNTSQA